MFTNLRLILTTSMLILSPDKYYAYFTMPFVKFVKDKISQLVFIVLHYRVCTLDSTVGPMVEEYLIFVFFCGMVLNEYQQYHQIESPRQYKTSKYFKYDTFHDRITCRLFIHAFVRCSLFFSSLCVLFCFSFILLFFWGGFTY